MGSRMQVDRVIDGVDRGHPDRPLQRLDPAGHSRPRGSGLIDPRREPRPRPPGRRLPDRRQLRAGGPCRRVPLRSHRVVRLRLHQHDPDRGPRRRLPAGPTTACSSSACSSGDRRVTPTSPAWSSSRSTGSPIRSSPDGCARARSTRSPSWVRDGTHKLSRWEAILPSMTSGSQAGILHGNNDGIPAFRWYERDREHLMASSNPADATLIVVADLERRRSAVEQRREHLQPHERRRDSVLPDDGDDQGRGWRDRRQQRIHVVLLQPDRLPALVHVVRRRVHQGAVPGSANTPIRRPAADASRLEVRRDARRQQRHPAGRQHRPDHRGDVPRRERHLRGLHRLRRAGAPLRSGEGRIVRGARRRRCGHRLAGQGDGRSATSLQVHRPVRPRPESRRDVPSTLWRQSRRVRPQPDERSRHRLRVEDQGRGVCLRQLVPVRDHPEQGRRSDASPVPH